MAVCLFRVMCIGWSFNAGPINRILCEIKYAKHIRYTYYMDLRELKWICEAIGWNKFSETQQFYVLSIHDQINNVTLP